MEEQNTSKDSKSITPEEIDQLGKLYYPIGEVAKMFNVNPSLIRYWEKEFTILKPKKNLKGNRQFTKKDIEYIHKIYYLVKDMGMTLDGAKAHLKNHSQDDGVANFEIIKTLQNLKNMILDLKDSLDEKKEK